MFSSRQLVAVVSLVTAVTLAGCGGSEPSGPPPSIQVSVNPSSLTVEQGASGTVSIGLTRSGGFAGAVNATVEGLPAGVTVSVSPATLTTSTTSATVTVTVAVSVAPGTYPATVRANALGVGEATITFNLTVTPLPDFALTATGVTIPAGLSGTSTISIVRTSFPGAVALSLSNPPAGVTGNFNPGSASGTSSELTISVAKTVAPGTLSLTVQGVATGPGTKTTTVALTVTPEPSYTLTMTPPSLQVLQGAQQAATVNIARTNFTGPVTLSLDNAPAGITATFDPPAPTGNSSAMTLIVGANVATGPQVLTIKGTAAGVPSGVAPAPSAAAGDRSITLAVDVMSALLAVTPATVTVAQGQSGQAAVSITRAASLTGPIGLSVTGRPNAARMTFGPNPATGNTATLTIDAQGSTPGTYPITIHSTTGAPVNPTATLDLVITAPTGNTVDYRFCGGFPSWFAAKDGTGAWTQITSTVTGNVMTFSFPMTSDFGEIAYTLPLAALRADLARIAEGASGGPSRAVGQEFGAQAIRASAVSLFNTIVTKATRAELQRLGACQPGTTATGSLQVTATGIPAGQIAVFQMRSALQLNFNTSGTQSFPNIFTGTDEWMAIYIPQSGPWPAYNRGVLTVPGSVTIDGANALPLLAAPVTVTGTTGGTFAHRNGFQGGFGRIATFNLGGTAAATTFHGFAATQPGDLFSHGFTWNGPVAAMTADQLTVVTYLAQFGSLTVAAPPVVPTFTSQLLAPAPQARIRSSGSIPTEYQDGMIQASFYDGTGQIFLQSFPGYRAAVGSTATYQLDSPDFTGANYPAGAHLGMPVSTAVLMNGTNVVGKLVNGSRDYQAIRFQPPPS